MAQQRSDKPGEPAPRQDSHLRGKRETEDPSGHNTQVKPAQQEQIAKSEEHREDAARNRAPSDVDQETVNELKD